MTICTSDLPITVVQVVERRFNLINGWPSELKLLLEMMMREERKKCVAAEAMEISVEDYFAEEKSPELPSGTLYNLRDFEIFLFSPNRNGPIKDPDHPCSNQEAMVSGCVPAQVSANLKTLKVKIYMGYGWKIDYPKLDKHSPPDLFVNLQMQRLSTGKTTVKKTKVQRDNWTPYWGDEFEFPLYSPSENASLRVEVYDFDKFKRNDFAGWTTLPVSQLRPGIRAVPLLDEMGNQCSVARLLIGFMFV